jgi:REP element-mobilizing transposase RayT
MPRKPRVDYHGAVHHVFVRGVNRSVIAVDEDDYETALGFLDRAIARFEIECHAWCFLPNHTHLLLTSRHKNLSRVMHWIGTCTAQAFNRRHARVGHVYQGRFGSRLVEKDGHLLELARYIPHNPVRAGMCDAPEDWHWSSYAATVGACDAPWFLDHALITGKLGSIDAYAAWVGRGMLATALDENGAPVPAERPRLDELLADRSERALATAHFRHGYSKAEIARHLRVSEGQIRRRLAAAR